MEILPINVFAINLIHRTDRKANITAQFHGKEEFKLTVVPAIESPIGALGLWQTIQKIVQREISRGSDFFILCEDDHQFTNDYSKERLLASIQEAEQLEADILSGGVSWFDTGIQIAEGTFWVKTFNGMQFTVIFNRFYSKIEGAEFKLGDAADFKISALSDSKLVMYPFISVQKEFGYSDVTRKNNEEGFVSRIFDETSNRFAILKKVRSHYLSFHQ